MDNKNKAKLGLLAVTVLWALAPSFIKLSLEELQEFNLIAFRFVIAFALLLLLFRKKIAEAGRATYIRAFFLSLVLFLVFVSMTFGVRFTTASKAGFLTCLSVIFVPFLTHLFFGRKPELKIIIGTVITIAGVGLLTLKSNLSVNPGDLLCLLCSLLYGLYIIMTERYASQCEPIALSVIQMGLVGLYSVLLTLLIEEPHLPARGITWTAVIVMALFCTAAAFLVQTVSQKHIKSEDAAVINTMEPLFTVVFASLFLHESMSAREILGAAILLGGVLVTQLDALGIKISIKNKWRVGKS